MKQNTLINASVILVAAIVLAVVTGIHTYDTFVNAPQTATTPTPTPSSAGILVYRFNISFGVNANEKTLDFAVYNSKMLVPALNPAFNQVLDVHGQTTSITINKVSVPYTIVQVDGTFASLADIEVALLKYKLTGVCRTADCLPPLTTAAPATSNSAIATPVVASTVQPIVPTSQSSVQTPTPAAPAPTLTPTIVPSLAATSQIPATPIQAPTTVPSPTILTQVPATASGSAVQVSATSSHSNTAGQPVALAPASVPVNSYVSADHSQTIYDGHAPSSPGSTKQNDDAKPENDVKPASRVSAGDQEDQRYIKTNAKSTTESTNANIQGKGNNTNTWEDFLSDHRVLVLVLLVLILFVILSFVLSSVLPSSSSSSSTNNTYTSAFAAPSASGSKSFFGTLMNSFSSKPSPPVNSTPKSFFSRLSNSLSNPFSASSSKTSSY